MRGLCALPTRAATAAAEHAQRVHSLDLVAAAPGVIACNMADTPLQSGSCDAAVFSLALMGTDYGAFLTEAARVLKQAGWLWIAEVRACASAAPRARWDALAPQRLQHIWRMCNGCVPLPLQAHTHQTCACRMHPARACTHFAAAAAGLLA